VPGSSSDSRSGWLAARMTSARRRVGWLAALSLLLHGWLPVVLQASVTAGKAERRHSPDPPICSAAVASAATAPQPARGPECPVTHDPVCLCAIFASLLAPGPGATPGPPPAVRGARCRLPTRRPGRSRPIPPFEARAPPAFG
jgi:hypothetical protein